MIKLMILLCLLLLALVWVWVLIKDDDDFIGYTLYDSNNIVWVRPSEITLVRPIPKGDNYEDRTYISVKDSPGFLVKGIQKNPNINKGDSQ